MGFDTAAIPHLADPLAVRGLPLANTSVTYDGFTRPDFFTAPRHAPRLRAARWLGPPAGRARRRTTARKECGMKLIILAAGKGERLLPLTRNTPKPLLDMGNGYTLLEEQMRAAQASGVVAETVLVVGYLASQVEAKLDYHRDQGLCVRTVYNPFYEVSNNLMSLWLTRRKR